MAGIYIHIPFCKRACHYCNFHFSTSLALKDELIECLAKEISMQKYFFGEKTILETIYFGGGTPSLLQIDDLKLLMETIQRHFDIAKNAEITLEANPDDLTIAYLEILKNSPVNRLSIGIQSFADADLQYMNRAHNGKEALASLKNAQSAGFENLSADLIFGTPTLTDDILHQNLETLSSLKIPHISAYALTVEPKTALDKMIKASKIASPEEETTARQFLQVMDFLEKKGYSQYEISNYALPGKMAVHNTHYWKNIPYLGIGPSAHSFKENTRSWNVSNNARYVGGIKLGEIPSEIEVLSLNDQFNEYVMTSLRTMWGIDMLVLEKIFGIEFKNHLELQIQPFTDQNLVNQKGNIFTLTQNGKLYADRITSELFVVN